MTPCIKYIALDMGQVLVNVRKKAVAEKLHCSFVEVESAFFANEEHAKMSQGADPDLFLERAASALNISKASARFAWQQVVKVKKGAFDLVQKLNRPVVAWSNTDPIHFDEFAKDLPAALFNADKRALSFELLADKPSLLFFQQAVERLKVAPQEIFFIDDKIENIVAARALHISAYQAEGLQAVSVLLEKHGLLADG